MGAIIKSEQFGMSYATKLGNSPGIMGFRLFLEGSKAHKTKIAAIEDFVGLFQFFDFVRSLFGFKQCWVTINVVDTNGDTNEVLLNIKSLCKRTVLNRGEILNKTADELSACLAKPEGLERSYPKLTEMYPHAYLINLDHRQDRITDLHGHLASIGQPDFTYTRLSAVVGKDLPPEMLNKMSKSGSAEAQGKDDRAGRMGCFLSHLNAVKRAKAEGKPNILILEDDVRFMPQSIATGYAQKAMKELPQDWGMFFLGQWDFDKENEQHYSKHLVKPSQPYETHAYMINASMYDTMIETLEKELEKDNGQMRAVDVLIAEELTKTRRVYAAKTHVAIQDEGLSSIVGQYSTGHYPEEVAELRRRYPTPYVEGVTADGMPVMNPLLAGTLYQMMHHVDKVFAKHGIVYWADSGTLLGATRHKALIPHDDDLDVGIMPGAEEILKSDAFKADLQELGLQIEPHWVGFKIFAIKDHPLGKTYVNFDGYDYKVPSMDVFTMLEKTDPATGETIYRYKEQKAFDIWHHIFYKASELFNEEGKCHRIPFGPIMINGIKAARDFCARTYGKNSLNEVYLQWDHIEEKPIEQRPIQLTDFRGPAFIQWEGLPQI